MLKNHTPQLSKNPPQNYTLNFTTFSQNNPDYTDKNAGNFTDFDTFQSGFFGDELFNDFSTQKRSLSSTKFQLLAESAF